MTEREEVVAAIVSAAGGELTGKVRLQKIVYLLDQLGLNSGFNYEYYHYGPFSRDVVNATEDAKAFDLIEEHMGRRSSDGAPFSIFLCKTPAKSEAFGDLDEVRAKNLVDKLKRVEATVLELAATAHWLSTYEFDDDWAGEIVRRKGIKCQEGRLEKALTLLDELELPPAVAL